MTTTLPPYLPGLRTSLPLSVHTSLLLPLRRERGRGGKGRGRRMGRTGFVKLREEVRVHTYVWRNTWYQDCCCICPQSPTSQDRPSHPKSSSHSAFGRPSFYYRVHITPNPTEPAAGDLPAYPHSECMSELVRACRGYDWEDGFPRRHRKVGEGSCGLCHHETYGVQ